MDEIAKECVMTGVCITLAFVVKYYTTDKNIAAAGLFAIILTLVLYSMIGVKAFDDSITTINTYPIISTVSIDHARKRVTFTYERSGLPRSTSIPLAEVKNLYPTATPRVTITEKLPTLVTDGSIEYSIGI